MNFHQMKTHNLRTKKAVGVLIGGRGNQDLT